MVEECTCYSQKINNTEEYQLVTTNCLVHSPLLYHDNRSIGHIIYVFGYEYYLRGYKVYKALKDDPILETGYRAGIEVTDDELKQDRLWGIIQYTLGLL